MSRNWTRQAATLALIGLGALVLSACYRSAGGSLEPTAVGEMAQVAGTPLPLATFTLPAELGEPTAETMTEMPGAIEPSLSPFPTLAKPSETPAAGEGVLDGQGGGEAVAILPTNVVQPSSTPNPTATPTQTPSATFTPPPTSTPAATPTATFGPTNTFTPVPFQPLGPSPTYTPFYVSPAPQEAVPLGERATQPQGEAPAVVVVVTPTPAIVAQAQPPVEEAQPQEAVPLGEQPAVAQAPTLSSFQMTATQIVFEATATGAAQQGIQLATLTPMPGQAQPVQPGQGGQAETIIITATPLGAATICDEHLIAPGETLSRIALTYGVTTAQLAQANNIVNPDLILAGDTLQIPCPVPATPTPIATPGSVGAQSAGQDGQGGYAGTQTYTVEPGDNLYRISLRFGVTMSELMAANGMSPATMNNIYVGQQLVIPAGATTALPTLTPAVGAAQPPTPIYIIVTATPGFAG